MSEPTMEEEVFALLARRLSTSSDAENTLWHLQAVVNSIKLETLLNDVVVTSEQNATTHGEPIDLNARDRAAASQPGDGTSPSHSPTTDWLWANYAHNNHHRYMERR